MCRRLLPAVLFLLAAPLSLRADGRLPVPDAAAQAKAEKLIKQLFRADYLKGRLANRLALAQRLFDQAAETKDDPVDRFVLLREARDVAAKAGDVKGAHKAIARLAQLYEVPVAEMKAGVLEAARRSPYAPLPAKDAVELALAALPEATDEDDYAAAARLLKVAEAAAPRTRSVPLLAAVRSQAKQVEELRKEYEQARPDLEAVRKKRDDPAVNFRAGKYLCANKGRWARGLPLLANGSDAKWKAPAELDLAGPQAARQQAQLADAWWDLAEGLPARQQRHLRRRAAHWYKQALPELAGLARTKAANRLKEVEPAAEVAATGTWLVVFRSDDPRIWNSKVNEGEDRRAIPLQEVPDNIQFLKLTSTRGGDYVILPMTKQRLGVRSEAGGFGWEGKNPFSWGAHQLGVYNLRRPTKQKGDIGVCINPAPQHSYHGWGFGVRGGFDDRQGYTWAGKEVPPTVFEVAVTAGPLTEAESAHLLTK